MAGITPVPSDLLEEGPEPYLPKKKPHRLHAQRGSSFGRREVEALLVLGVQTTGGGCIYSGL